MAIDTNGKRPWALVTGASGGIGRDLATLAAQDGYSVALVARRRPNLEALAAELKGRFLVEARVIEADLSRPEAPESVIRETADAGMAIEILVNNAGFGLHGEFARSDWRREQEMMQLNMVTLVDLTKRVLPGMIARGQGRILNVASTAAFVPGPRMAVYFASKAFVLSFSEALAVEVQGTGVSVTCLCPGPTETEFAQRSGAHMLFANGAAASMDVARKGYQAMKRGKTVYVHGTQNWLMMQSLRFAPRKAVARIARNMLRP